MTKIHYLKRHDNNVKPFKARESDVIVNLKNTQETTRGIKHMAIKRVSGVPFKVLFVIHLEKDPKKDFFNYRRKATKTVIFICNFWGYS